MEDYDSQHMGERGKRMSKLSKKDIFQEELADAVIRIVGCSHGLGFDLGEAIVNKLAKNRTRGCRHGGKRV